MFGKKKKQETNFDNLKYDDYQYHYSRAEREKMKRRSTQKEEVPQKGLARIFGKNKMFRMMLGFYVVVAGLIWFYFYASKASGDKAFKQSFEFADDTVVEVRLLTNESRKGFNISIENEGSEILELSNLTLISGDYVLSTNLNLTLAPGEFNAYFIPTKVDLSNLYGMKAELY